MQVCDRICILRDGRVAKTGPVSAFTLKDIAREMLGKEVKEFTHRACGECGRKVLEVRNFNSGEKLFDINLVLNKGEVLGLWGLMGSGRTELIRALLGLDPINSGSILVYDDDGRTREIHPTQLLERVGYVTETRHDDGLFLPQPVWWNISSASLAQFIKKPFNRLDSGLERIKAEKIASELNVAMPGINAAVSQLSGGNQQKIVIAKWLQRKPDIYLLDEPTRGVDVGAKSEIQRFIRQLASEGASVLLVSSEIEEILNLSDRVMVIHKGKIVEEVPFREIEKDRLMALSVGEKI